MNAAGNQTLMGSNSRKRPRDNETEAERVKREKAAERQRRKRENDRAKAMGIYIPSPSSSSATKTAALVQSDSIPPGSSSSTSSPNSSVRYDANDRDAGCSPEERARRMKVREAAKLRQRKHRQAMKQRKEAQLGMEMGNEFIHAIEDMHFRPNGDGYPAVMHEMPGVAIVPDAPTPPGHGGQTFATTLLLSFSCVPLLKQHLLRNLSMTNEELASLEPVIADAWERWNHQRQLHYQAQAEGGPGGAPASYPIGDPAGLPNGHLPVYPPPPPPSTGPNDPNEATANEFRARFHRSIVAPSPFTVSSATSSGVTGGTMTPDSTASTPQPVEDTPIDPHLTSNDVYDAKG